ncbi:DNA cytosine methyltransferase [Laribacter hongkongensis]|uniref:DNA cytosine methyltransferase n=1 Tax=Laribacter hongkongensis TaxID=168471 RepID=UPI001EFC80B6|nr:DNA cytosine methyltransferase [Laribacter hongkongensis]MCG9076229.1 DNA cytosine methyltransferase [Laribacter hongkongensis]
MTAYYNELDPYAAQWLRNLIKAGHIAPGDVDERSIEDVHPDDLTGYTQCHFFAGIGIWSHALRQAGWPDDRPVWTGSCPCQPFSAAGRRLGVTDKRHLWPHFYHLISKHRPVTVIGEQVASPDGLDWLDTVSADMENAGYAVGAADLCAAGVGAPHIRQRLYWLAHADMQHKESTRNRARTGNTGRIGTPGGLANDNSHRPGAARPAGRTRTEQDAEPHSANRRLADSQRQRVCPQRPGETDCQKTTLQAHIDAGIERMGAIVARSAAGEVTA